MIGMLVPATSELKSDLKVALGLESNDGNPTMVEYGLHLIKGVEKVDLQGDIKDQFTAHMRGTYALHMENLTPAMAAINRTARAGGTVPTPLTKDQKRVCMPESAAWDHSGPVVSPLCAGS